MQGVAVTEEGWRFPPFIVVERGESLDEWRARIQPDFPTIVQVLSHVTERVKTMHDLGLIHRDLKPGNVLRRPHKHSWTLIDFGCAAQIGATPPIHAFRPAFGHYDSTTHIHCKVYRFTGLSPCTMAKIPTCQRILASQNLWKH